MSLFDDYVATLAAVGGALVNAASAVVDAGTQDPSDPDNVARDLRVRDAYIVARVNVAVAEALAKQALLETGDKAAQLVKSAALMVGRSEQNLIDAAAREKDAVVQDVKDAYQKAVDVGAAAVKGVHDQVVRDVGGAASVVANQLEVGLVISVLGLLAYLWYEKSKKGPSAAEMRRAVLVGEP